MIPAEWKGPGAHKRSQAADESLVLKGHEFTRAMKPSAVDPALAAEGCYFCGFDSGAGFDGSSAFGEDGPK